MLWWRPQRQRVPHAQGSSQSNGNTKALGWFPAVPTPFCSIEWCPLISCYCWTLSRPPQPLPSSLYLVTSGAAWPQQLRMMTAAVQAPIVVEVDEVYQGLATGLAGKASPVPATLLSCPGCKHSVFPWPHLLPALPGRGAGWSKAAPPSQCFSWLFHPNRNLFSPYFWASPLPLQAPVRTPKLGLLFSKSLSNCQSPNSLFPPESQKLAPAEVRGQKVEEGEY